jgi:hypothetical protein
MIDTLKYVDRLKAAGVAVQQAEAMARALQEAHANSDLIDKAYLTEQLAPVRTDLVLMKWMVGAALVGHVVTWGMIARLLVH